MCVCLCVCRGRREAKDPLELEEQTVVCCLMWVLGTKLRSSGEGWERGKCSEALNHLSGLHINSFENNTGIAPQGLL